MKQFLTVLVIFILCTLFFSYRLLDTPQGITTDEAAFGYNASLISQTLRDENNRLLPIFVLSLDGRDWRQPITQYFQALTFKIFGRSLFNLKFTSVIVASFSAVLIFILAKQLFNLKTAALALIIFLTTPIVMIHSHMALDNIMPIPFILIWIWGLVNFQKKKSLRYLIISGISLGLSFYAHKSLRSAAPIWTVLTVFYLVFHQVKNLKVLTFKNYLPVIYFIFSIAPFYLITPLLEYKYAGAVFSNQNLSNSSFYDFFYFYISSFDISFLFIKGDTIMHHSTGKHGMFLLSTLPLFIYGIYKSTVSKNRLLIFLTLCFFSGPLFLGFIGSTHRASRMLFLVPIFTIIAAFGFAEFLKLKKLFKIAVIIFSLIFVINFLDFIKYYWYQYPKDTYHIFYNMQNEKLYQKFYEVSQKEKLTVFIDNDLLNTQGDGGTVEDFARSLYFVNPDKWNAGDILNSGSILLTQKQVKDLESVESGIKDYYFYIRRD